MSAERSRCLVHGVLVGCFLLAGCNGSSGTSPDAGSPGPPDAAPPDAAPPPPLITRNIDILFVIDNSGSMGEEQRSLADNFSRFVDVLENIEGGMPSLHIGVVSSNVGVGPYVITSCAGNGDNGLLLKGPYLACESVEDRWIEDLQLPDGNREKNYPASITLADMFGCMAELGTIGCGLEQHLESMKRALDGTNPENTGFLRADALLAVIILADEDDCSAADTGVFDPAQTNISDPLGPLSSFRCTEFGVMCDGAPIERGPAEYSSCEPRPDSYLRHPREYADFLKSLKSDPRYLTVAGIIGDPMPVVVRLDMDSKPELLPSCETAAGKAAPAVRLKYFLDQFPGRNTVLSICNEDLSDPLTKVAELVARSISP